jgi:hypothetical protein
MHDDNSAYCHCKRTVPSELNHQSVSDFCLGRTSCEPISAEIVTNSFSSFHFEEKQSLVMVNDSVPIERANIVVVNQSSPANCPPRSTIKVLGP